jgi:hypothetical protein
MGSTMCKGGSLQQVYNLIKSNYPNPKIRIIQRLYKFTTNEIYKDDTIDTRYTRDKRFHTLGPSMPQVALTPLGLPSLASNHKSTQGSNK